MSIHRVAAIASFAAVAVAVVAGLMLIGSPSEQRVLRLDERRVMDLRQLATSVNMHWNQRHELPITAERLVDGQLLTRLPLDPESNQPYDYRVTEQSRFELCATFGRRARAEDSRDFWFHGAGRRCFSFDATARVY